MLVGSERIKVTFDGVGNPMQSAFLSQCQITKCNVRKQDHHLYASNFISETELNVYSLLPNLLITF